MQTVYKGLYSDRNLDRFVDVGSRGSGGSVCLHLSTVTTCDFTRYTHFDLRDVMKPL